MKVNKVIILLCFVASAVTSMTAMAGTFYFTNSTDSPIFVDSLTIACPSSSTTHSEEVPKEFGKHNLSKKNQTVHARWANCSFGEENDIKKASFTLGVKDEEGDIITSTYDLSAITFNEKDTVKSLKFTFPKKDPKFDVTVVLHKPKKVKRMLKNSYYYYYEDVEVKVSPMSHDDKGNK